MTTNINETFISVKDAAERAGISTQRFRTLLRRGDISGAARIGERVWAIPKDFEMTPRPGKGRPRRER